MTDFTPLKWTHGQSNWDVQYNAVMDLATAATGNLEAWQASVGATSGTAQGVPAIGGTMSFTINETGRSFPIGASYQAYRLSSPSTIAIGTVSAWMPASNALTLSITQGVAASGPFTDWVITPVPPGAFPVQAGNANAVALTNGSGVVWQPMAQVRTRSGTALVGVSSATVALAGTNYAPGDKITVNGGVATAQAVLAVLTTVLVGLAAAGGTGYAVNDLITLSATGGTMTTAPVVKVASVSAGAITGISISNPGAFTVNATGFVQASTSGAGSGASFTAPVFGVGSASATVPGAYTTPPPSPAGQGSTTGGGVGATFLPTTATAYTLAPGGGANGDLAVTQSYPGGGLLTIPALATLGANYVSYVYASGGAVTLYPTGTDTLNGLASPITVAKGNQAEIIVTSAASPGAAMVIQTGAPVSGTLPPQGRLTLTSGAPIMPADVPSATTIYYAPHVGNSVPISAGSGWVNTPFNQLALALDANPAHAGYHAAGSLFDLFVFLNNGVPTLGSGPAWTSTTARGTGGATTQLQQLNGLWTNANAITAKIDAGATTVTVPAGQATYVGTFYATAAGATSFNRVASSGFSTLGLWNTYNRVRTDASFVNVGSWYYGLNVAIHLANNTMRIFYVDGLAQSSVLGGYTANTSGSTAVQYLAQNSTTTYGYGSFTSLYPGTLLGGVPLGTFAPALGYNYIAALDATGGGNGGEYYSNGLLTISLEM